jgi:hypothetical protein
MNETPNTILRQCAQVLGSNNPEHCSSSFFVTNLTKLPLYHNVVFNYCFVPNSSDLNLKSKCRVTLIVLIFKNTYTSCRKIFYVTILLNIKLLNDKRN